MEVKGSSTQGFKTVNDTDVTEKQATLAFSPTRPIFLHDTTLTPAVLDSHCT